MARGTGYREARRWARCSPTTASPNQRGRVSNPDFSGSYPPEPAEPGRWGGPGDTERGGRYGDGRARGTWDAEDRGSRRERDYEWDRTGGSDAGYHRAGQHGADNYQADSHRADSYRADNHRADNHRADNARTGYDRASYDRADYDRAGYDQAADDRRAGYERADQSRLDQASAGGGQATRGSRRAAKDAGRGRRGTGGAKQAADEMSVKDRLAAKL